MPAPERLVPDRHFAYDLGIETVHDTVTALTSGDAVRVDLGRFRPGPQGPGGAHGYFLNAFSLGVYPELVRTRERWAPRIGGWPAGVLAAFEVLRGERPLTAELQGRKRPLWLLFVGNGLFQRVGPAPGRRHNLADGLLDVRVVHGGRTPGLRLLAAAIAGPLSRSPVHAAVRRRQVRIPTSTSAAPRASSRTAVTSSLRRCRGSGRNCATSDAASTMISVPTRHPRAKGTAATRRRGDIMITSSTVTGTELSAAASPTGRS